MPIENENKYIILPPFDVAEKVISIEANLIKLRQAYLPGNVRIRAISNSASEEKFEFAYKKKIGNNSIEIEKEISQRDFDILWGVKLRSLTKNRYELPIVCQGEQWVADFMYDDGQVYFAYVECEMDSEDQVIPAVIPEVLVNFLHYPVPRTLQNIYSSKKLAKVDYATELLKSLIQNLEA